MSYFMVNTFDKAVTSFKTLKEVTDWLREISLFHEIDEFQHFEIQKDFTELVRFYRNGNGTYSISTRDGYLYHVQEEEFGPLFEVQMDNGNLRAIPLGKMTWEAVLAVIGLYRGHCYRRAE